MSWNIRSKHQLDVVRDRHGVNHWSIAPCIGANKVTWLSNGASVTCLWCMRAWLCGP